MDSLYQKRNEFTNLLESASPFGLIPAFRIPGSREAPPQPRPMLCRRPLPKGEESLNSSTAVVVVACVQIKTKQRPHTHADSARRDFNDTMHLLFGDPVVACFGVSRRGSSPCFASAFQSRNSSGFWGNKPESRRREPKCRTRTIIIHGGHSLKRVRGYHTGYGGVRERGASSRSLEYCPTLQKAYAACPNALGGWPAPHFAQTRKQCQIRGPGS